MNIYEIADNYIELLRLMETEDLDADCLKDTIEAVEGDFEIKAENYAKIIKNLESDIAGFKAEEERLSTKRKTLERNIENMKKALYEAMKITGKEKFKSGVFSFSINKNGGKIPICLDVDVEKLPKQFVIIYKKPNNDALRQHLEEKGKTKYCHFGERGEHLKIK